MAKIVAWICEACAWEIDLKLTEADAIRCCVHGICDVCDTEKTVAEIEEYTPF